MQRFRADWIWTPEGPLRGGEVAVGPQGELAEVRATPTPGAAATELRGLLLPGLVNAHAHLELSDLRGQVPGGQGLSTWAMALLARRRPPQDEAIAAAVEEAWQFGTAAIVDTTNSGAPLPILADGPMLALGQAEVLGIEHERAHAARTAAARLMLAPGIPVVETCHAVVSCSDALLAAVLCTPTSPRPMQTMHCDEDEADQRLLATQDGPWAEFLDRLGRQWRGRIGQAESVVRLLDDLGVLGPHLGLVHCVCTAEPELRRIARRGATVILCPRSNLHINGRLPDVPAMLRLGIPLAIGTDSLASVDDLDLLAEAATLRRAFPEVEASAWIEALTVGGARLFLDAHAADRAEQRRRAALRGGLRAGGRHGLLHLSIPSTEDPAATLLSGPRWPRRWLGLPRRDEA